MLAVSRVNEKPGDYTAFIIIIIVIIKLLISGDGG